MKNILYKIIFSILLVVVSSTAMGHKAKHTIRFASIAIKGTTPINVMNDLREEIKDKTNGEVDIRIYAGNQGDEATIIRKIRTGRLHSAGFTGRGLGEIAPVMRVMELPFLFNNYDEVDYIVDKMYDVFSAEFEKNGYKLMGWSEVGFVHIFSNVPIRTIDDLKGVKMWMWEGDPLVKALFEELDVVPTALAITDVLTSLQTGLIDAVYSSPYGAIALQWHFKSKFMLETPITNAAGAVVIEKETFDDLPEEYQQILLDSFKKWMRELVVQTRKDNENSIETIKNRGIEVVPGNAEDLSIFNESALRVREKMIGELYPREVLDEVLRHLEEYRANHK
ncbi:MAG: ABC transporter substrate-binding protein [bacterium]|nr:ABC transporter substrate-binding protein [bacterium]